MVNVTDTRAAEIAELEAKVARLETAQFSSSMSNGFYYSDGSKARDDIEIKQARDALAEAKKNTINHHYHADGTPKRMRPDGSTF
jgi:hypothetical protein